MQKKPLNPQLEPRQARLIGVQDDEGYHLCTGLIKSVGDNGAIEFEDQGKKVLTYAAYEVAIQDLESCLAHVNSMRDAKIAKNKFDPG